MLAAASLFGFVLRLSEPGSVTPWESSIAMEAVRLNHGLPLYEAGHATHLYGPGLTLLLAGIFRITGLSLVSARAVFSLFAIALVAFMTWLLCRGRRRGEAFLVAALFLGINLRTLYAFTTAQPDAVSALLAVIALYLWITRRHSRVRFFFSLGLFVAAMFVKQTAAAFALIPIAHQIFWSRDRWSRALCIAAIPTALLLGVLLALRIFFPAVFAGMVSIPGALRIYYSRVLPLALLLIGTFPLFFVAMVILFTRRIVPLRDRWIISSLAVLAPIGVWTVSKSGGSYNSFLFAYLALTAFAASQLNLMLRWIDRAQAMRAILGSCALALAIVSSFFFQFERALPVLFARCGDDKYDRAVQVAREIEPGVISPQDPTIAYRANGYFGRSIYFELDAHPTNGDWPVVMPAGLHDEIKNARAVIEVQNYMPTAILARTLTEDGFHRVAAPGLEDSAYTVWLR